MKLQLLSLLSAFLITEAAASSLRGRILNRDRSKYSLNKGRGGGASGSSTSSSTSSATSLSAWYTSIIADTDPFPSELVTGEDDDLFLGYSVSYAGDVNGDGIDDVIVGGPQKNLDDATLGVGAAFVIFGKQDTLPDLSSIDSLDGINGFAFFGTLIGSDAGFVVSNAGDVNDDGLDDIIIGAPNADGPGIEGCGEAYVIFGRSTAFPKHLTASDLDGTLGFVVQGNDAFDHLGSSVSAAGDVNGDLIADIIIGAPNAGRGGEAYVILGSSNGFSGTIFVSSLGSSGITVQAASDDDWLGLSVAAVGDLNDDGMDDFLVGAPQAEDSFGAVYVIYGTKAASVPVSSLEAPSGTNGYTILGTHQAAKFGTSLAPAGDVNGDGTPDFVVGCPNCREGGTGLFDAGAAFIFFGSPNPVNGPIDAVDADSILWGQEAFDWVGVDVAAAGDVNDDGFDDIVVGASRSVYSKAILCIIYGGPNLQPSMQYDDIDNTDQGMIINLFSNDSTAKNDRVMSVSNAGDFNGDGTQDLIIGLPDVDPGDGPEYAQGHVKILIVHPQQF